MRSKLTILGFILVALVAIQSGRPDTIYQKKKPFREMAFGFYNVENLFDTLDNPLTKDDEFTPSSEKAWNSQRYQKKLNDLAHGISMMGNELPGFVGLCEVENIEVVKDLVKTDVLKPGKYGVIHSESPDLRGIDVAFIYRKGYFKPKNVNMIQVDLGPEERPTRDIMYVKGTIKGKTELHIFINHWPSRYGGVKASDIKRAKAAKALAHHVDSLLLYEPNTAVICMGDFNDYPVDESVREILGASSVNDDSKLVNLMFDEAETNMGSYNFKGQWGFLDQIIVSPILVNEKLPLIKSGSTGAKFDSTMTYTNKKSGEMSPNRTYGGPNYYGGFSDHFPVAATLIY